MNLVLGAFYPFTRKHQTKSKKIIIALVGEQQYAVLLLLYQFFIPTSV